MNECSLTILTGPVRSGKTSFLLKNYQYKPNVYGILTPVINSERIFLALASNETFPMQASEHDKEVLAIGKYQFSKESFVKAIHILNKDLKHSAGTFILDEVGPLELKQEGFYEVVKKMISHQNYQLEKIIVIRESILADVIQFFQLENYKIQRMAST